MNSIPHIHQLLELLAKSALLLAVTALLATTWRRGSAAQRCALWLGAFVALLLLPLTKLVPPLWRLPGSPVAPSVIDVAPTISNLERSSGPAIAEPAPAPASAPAWHWPDASRMLAGLWLTGVLGLLAYRLLGSVQIARLQRRSQLLDDPRTLALAHDAAAELHLAHHFEIRVAATPVPCTWGVRRPVVLLPSAAVHWSDAHLLAALRHEFGHIARHDYLARWVGQIACALYWPNPLVWLAARSFHSAQEQACDDHVLRAGTPATEYAALLFDAASACALPGLKIRHAVAMARPSTLEGRVLAIVDETRNRRPAGMSAGVAAAVVVVAALGMSAFAQIGSDVPVPRTLSAVPAAADAAPQLQIEAKFVEVRSGQWPESEVDAVNVRTSEQATGLLRKMQSDARTQIVSNPRVITHSGERAMVQIGKEVKLPENAQPPTTFVGITFDIVPTLEADAVKLDVKVKLTSLRSGSLIHVRDSKASVSLEAGQTLVLAGGQGEAMDRQMVIFIETHQVVPGGGGRAPAEARGAASSLRTAPTREVPRAYTDPATLILPRFEFRDATVAECLDYLRRKSRELDAAGNRGVNFVLVPRTDGSDPRISLSLQDIPLDEALKYVATLARLEIAYEPHAILLRESPVESPQAFGKIPIDINAEETRIENGIAVATGDATLTRGRSRFIADKLSYDPSTRTVRSDGPARLILSDPSIIPPVVAFPDPSAPISAIEAKAKSIIIPKFEVREATLLQAVEFLKQKCRESDPEKKGFAIDVSPALAKRAGAQGNASITISLANVPAFEALKYVANLAGAKCVVTESALSIVPADTIAPAIN
jgi:beta-lactamase regulating signal transducer with metallopeptidase domain